MSDQFFRHANLALLHIFFQEGQSGITDKLAQLLHRAVYSLVFILEWCP